ncbi:hypothetical protein SKAU_G00236110 [Synaphobranchus kaupii]|uniref:Gypsy retrotransposon integrase-like protein 1 n=1 Tax=Synaphobranchus kaupii TaxID=118154 RepID=A0A9Q1ISV1_SYNKA|nr:hypothetical protein SKAU_G00236110 [Synaphobranchus kaupii]
MEQNSEGLTEQQQRGLWDVLYEHRAAFATSPTDLGQTHLLEHHIDTGAARPIRQRPRRIPDLSLRFCVDMRPLNDVTVKDAYPLPRVDEALDKVRGSSWFSTLDLRSGYWQVPRSAESRPKMAFSTRTGIWQFTVMPFGLCNAPATFERLMEKVLADVPTENVQVYLDDVLIHAPDFDTALRSLHLAISKIKEAGLKLHPEKCKLLRQEITFLGHQVSGAGVAAMEGKVAAQAFETLKESLCQAPVLVGPDLEGELVLDTDVSNEGLGAVLAQVTPSGERVIAYYSRALSKPERNYCITRRELLAVVEAVSHFSRAEVREVEAAKAWGEQCMALRLEESADWAKDQREDTELSKILCWLEGGRKTDWPEVAAEGPVVKGLWAQWEGLMVQDEVLWRRWREPATGRNRWQVVVPESRRVEVLEVNHGQPGVGHFGVNKTPHQDRHTGDHRVYPRPVDVRPGTTDAAIPSFWAPSRHTVSTCMSWVRRPRERLGVARAFARQQAESAGTRQKRAYDQHTKGAHFKTSDLLLVYGPKRTKGKSPKLQSAWVGPCTVLERLGEVVYRVRLVPRGRAVVLHHDRLAPYRGAARPTSSGSPAWGTPHQQRGPTGTAGSPLPQPPAPAASGSSRDPGKSVTAYQDAQETTVFSGL